MGRWKAVVLFPAGVCALLFLLSGCRHVGVADESDGGQSISCDPCSEYRRAVYRCVAKACSGTTCEQCTSFLNEAEPECVSETDGGLDAGGTLDAGPGACVCDTTYGCEATCPCDPECYGLGDGGTGAKPCLGTNREYAEEELRIFSCESQLDRYGVDRCPPGTSDCSEAGAVCETGFCYFVPATRSLSCLNPGMVPLGEECSAPNECVPGAQCVRLYDRKTRCFMACNDVTECGGGEYCVPGEGFRVCAVVEE